MTSITPMNWRTNEAFVHFLQFEFDLNNASSDAKRQLLILLPLAVGDNRMTGSISNIVLKEAIKIWNRPAQEHCFIQEGKQWRYVGVDITRSPIKVVCRFGRLRRDLSPGAFCKNPVAEVIA